MTMLSFRIGAEEARRTQEWADRLGIDRSELLREAVRRHLNRLAAETEAPAWEDGLDESAGVLAEIADWGPAEDWSNWTDAQG